MGVTDQRPVDVGAIRMRRERLHAAAVELEEAADAPVQDRRHWYPGLIRAVEQLEEVLEQHVRATEAPDGLLESLVADSEGRLKAAVDRLRAEHPALRSATHQLLDGARHGNDPEQLRDEVTALFSSISRHRHRGSDLLYEAYHVDIGPAD